MKQVDLKFPDKQTFEKFMRYISIPRCKYSIENLSVTCEFDETYIRIAIEIFDTRSESK